MVHFGTNLKERWKFSLTCLDQGDSVGAVTVLARAY
jgi:hypothetical protein